MSPRAACRLEQLGYGPVYDYAWGKVDWLATGLPTEGSGPRDQRALDVLQPAVTCQPTSAVRDVEEAARAAGADRVYVVTRDECVLGRIKIPLGDGDPDRQAIEVMTPGPATVRAHEPLQPLRERVQNRNVTEMAVTTPEGHLLGVVRRTP